MTGSADVTTALCFAVLCPTLLVAHAVADHWVQTDRQAFAKGLPGWPGRRACLAHVASYTLVTALAVAAAWTVFGLSLTWRGVLLGQVVSATSHYWADRRTPLARLAGLTGNGRYLRFGAPRPGHDDNPGLGTGAYALDQSWHWLWLAIAAAVTSAG